MLTYANQNPAFCQISVTPAWTEFSFYLLSGAGQLIFQATRYLIDDSSSDPQWERGQPPWLRHKFQICLCPFWGTLVDWTSQGHLCLALSFCLTFLNTDTDLSYFLSSKPQSQCAKWVVCFSCFWFQGRRGRKCTEGRATGDRIREAWTGVFYKQSHTGNSLVVQ